MSKITKDGLTRSGTGAL